MDLNFNNTSLTDSGNIRFSGLSSGIDFQSSIDAIMEAKRIPVTLIEEKIQVNDSKAAALTELKSLSGTFASSLDKLRGSTSFFAEDVFDTKTSYLETQSSATAPVTHVPSAASSIMGVVVGKDAATGSHAIEVVQLAKANQIRSDAFTSKTADLDTLGFTMGTMEINGKSITVSTGDSLLDLRDKINATNSGDTPSNVNATIVSVSDTEHYLVIASTETGEDYTITFGGDQSVHNSLGFTTTGSDAVKNESVAAKNAIIRVDNLGVDIERQSNTIDDVLEGVTLNLFKAEEGTEVVLDIQEDLNTIKSTVVEFIEAFNALRDFITEQKTEIERVDGEDPTFGPLAFDSTLRQISTKLNDLVTARVLGAGSGYQSLSQVGITMSDEFKLEIDDTTFDDRIINDVDSMRKLFAFDFSSSDSRVLAVAHTSKTQMQTDANGDPIPYYLNIGGTDADGHVISANIQDTAGTGAGGAFDGSVSVSSSTMTISDASGAEGLKVYFNAGANSAPVNDIQISFSRGIADQLFTYFDDLSKSGGRLDDEIIGLANLNESHQERITQMEGRLDLQRTTLTAKFLAAEQAMLQLNNLKDNLTQTFEAMNNSSG